MLIDGREIFRQAAVRMPTRTATALGVLEREELDIKIALERTKRKLNSSSEYRVSLVNARAKLNRYNGSLKEYFSDYLEGLRFDRRQFLGYGAID